MSHQNIFEAAGPLSWTLFGLGIFAVTILIERTIYFQKIQINAPEFLDGITNLLKNNRFLEALTLCEETQGPVAAVIRAALLQCKNPNQQFQSAINSVALLEIPVLEKRQGLLRLLAGISPFMGLLGTVLACLDALYRLGEQERLASPADFAIDLSTALVTTALGLVIAIAAYCGSEFLRSRMDAIVREMEWAAHGISSYLVSGVSIHLGKSLEPFHKDTNYEDSSEKV